MRSLLTSNPHSEFHPNAFIGDDDIPQNLCNLILALALAYNDYKFYISIFNNHVYAKPKEKEKKNNLWGEYSGILFLLIRIHIGFTYELLNLIKKNEDLIEHDFFKEVIRMMDKKAKESWFLLKDTALSDKLDPSKDNPLYMIRNKLIHHYDLKEIFSGYKKGFFEDKKINEYACISLGNKLEEARFYFADKAAQGYLEKKLGTKADSFFNELRSTLDDVNIALYFICTNFIQRRGFAWRNPKEGDSP